MSSINYELYKVFGCVVKNGSITNAAKELYISQPAVSQAIKQLEAQLGGKLFKRTPKGMELTAEGLAMYEFIDRANILIDQAQTRFNHMKDLQRGSIKIGASDNICRTVLMPYVEKFHATYPKIKLTFVNGTSAQTVQLIKSGLIDVGIVNLPIDEPEILADAVGELHDCFVAGKNYPSLKGRRILHKELLKHPIILYGPETSSRKFIDDYFRSHNCVCNPEIEVGNHELLVAFAKRNMGVACVTEEFIRNDIEKGYLYKLSVEGDIRSRKIGLIRLKGLTQTFAAKKFIELMLSGN
ncbi:MAG: LysR family transcriptional regulator [Firmicutes bacterium]|nr:LysR family transcriptional regulator [Bacillota bacterium]